MWMFGNIDNIYAMVDTIESLKQQIEDISTQLLYYQEDYQKILKINTNLIKENDKYKNDINNLLENNNFLGLKSLKDVNIYLQSIIMFIKEIKKYNINNIHDILDFFKKYSSKKDYDNNYKIQSNYNINEIVTDYHLNCKSNSNKKYYNNHDYDIIKKMYEDKSFPKIIEEQNSKLNERLLDFNKFKEICLKELIFKNTKFYNLKINVNNIPVIIEYNKYEKNNFLENKLVPYFDINKYFKNIIKLFEKYNITFIYKKSKKYGK